MANEPQKAIELTGVKASTGSVDYYSVLTNVISIVMKDPAQMRGLIYELARMTLRREAFNKFPPLRGAELRTQVNKLEEAISRVELDQQAAKLPEYLPPARTGNDDSEARRPRELIVVSERPTLAQANRVFNVEQRPARWNFGFSLIGMLQLTLASFIGVLIFAFLNGGFDFGRNKQPAQGAPQQPAATPSTVIAQAPAPPPPPALPFAMPANYGVYALADGQLVELERMPMRMPDPRVQLSPDITMPPRVTVPDGKPTFVIYRRDLANSAPEKVPARVVARIARELTFKNGKAVTNNVENTWRVRNISYDLRVAPVPGVSEMIMIAPDGNTELPPGRYALVLNGLGYDFTVAGPVTSPEQCLEKSETTGAAIYTDCRML